MWDNAEGSDVSERWSFVPSINCIHYCFGSWLPYNLAFIIALEVDSPITLHIKDCTEKFTVAFSLEKEKKVVFNLLML